MLTLKILSSFISVYSHPILSRTDHFLQQNSDCCCRHSPLPSPSRLCLCGGLGAGLEEGPLGGRGAAAAPEGELETGRVQARRDPLIDSPTAWGPGLKDKPKMTSVAKASYKHAYVYLKTFI